MCIVAVGAEVAPHVESRSRVRPVGASIVTYLDVGFRSRCGLYTRGKLRGEWARWRFLPNKACNVPELARGLSARSADDTRNIARDHGERRRRRGEISRHTDPRLAHRKVQSAVPKMVGKYIFVPAHSGVRFE